jgi:uncharacterized protein
MRSGVLLDTGPLVAFLYRRDAYHDWAVETFVTFDSPAVTCEPVITEACFLIARNGQQANRVLDHVSRQHIRIGLTLDSEIDAIQALMRRYQSVPMSLADACLVRLAEMTGSPICTLDADFAIYRADGRTPLTLITPGRRSLHEP